MPKYVRHIIFWVVLYFLWSYMKTSGRLYAFIFKVNALNLLIYMAAYYFLRHVQLPFWYNKKKWTTFALSMLGTSCIFYLVWRLNGVWWIDEYFYSKGRKFMYMADFLTQTVQFYSPALLLLAAEIYHQRLEEKVRIQKLENEKIANELKFLKAQINPHFLFNTLNNLYAFVITNSPKAPDMILQLSGILDYVLYQSQKESVFLSEEIACIDNFIELEKTRYGNRLDIVKDIKGDLQLSLSPLILLSIVENAFKHGASGDIDHPKISIRIWTKADHIYCHVWNTKSKIEGEKNDSYKEGIGLSNIKRQLSLVYPNRHCIEIDDQELDFTLRLEIQTGV